MEAEIARCLEEATERSEVLQAQLKNLLDHSDVSKNLQIVVSIPERTRDFLDDVLELEKKIADSAILAKTMAEKVLDLDKVRERVQMTQRLARDIADVRRYADSVGEAMEKKDWNAAAEIVSKYKGIQSNLLDEDACAKLDKAASALQEVFNRKIDMARRAGTGEELARYSALASRIGGGDSGIATYASFLRGKVKIFCSAHVIKTRKAVEINDGKDALMQKGKNKAVSLCVCALTAMFEDVASFVTEHVPEVEKQFGGRHCLVVVREVEEECDAAAAALVELFGELRKVAAVATKLDAPGDETDPRSLSELLDVCALLSSRVELYHRFMRNQGRKAVALRGREVDRENGRYSADHGLLRLGVLDSSVQELLAHYLKIEECFMVRSVRKAIEMDEKNADGLTSQMVDYVFFVLQKSCHRALSTASCNVACAVLNMLNTCLGDFLKVMQTILRDTAVEASKKQDTKGKVGYSIVLNNLHTSVTYIAKLKNELILSGRKLFGASKKDVEKLESCWSDTSDTHRSFKTVLKNNLAQVAATLTPSVRSIVSTINNASYELSVEEFSGKDMRDSFVPLLCSKVEDLLKPFVDSLVKENGENLTLLILRAIIERLEKAVLKKTCNSLGTIQLSKDMNIIGRFFVSLSPTVRTELSRIQQMVMVLECDRESDVQEFAGESSWRLTAAETKRLLGNRVPD